MNRRGFTLVEMLVASALAAALMLAVMQIIGAIGRSRQALARSEGEAPWRAELLDTLRWDLANASEARFRRNRLILVGHAALDGRTLAPKHEPAQVMYDVTTLAGRNWLVRRQSPRPGFARGGRSMELLCPDVTAFIAEPLQNRGGRSADDATVPDRIALRVERAGAKPFEEELVLR